MGSYTRLILTGRGLHAIGRRQSSRESSNRQSSCSRTWILWLRTTLTFSNRRWPHAPVTAHHTTQALDDLLHTSQQLTRTLLGVDSTPDHLPAGGGIGSLPPQRERGRTGRPRAAQDESENRPPPELVGPRREPRHRSKRFGRRGHRPRRPLYKPRHAKGPLPRGT